MKQPVNLLRWLVLAALCGGAGVASASPGGSGGGHGGGSHASSAGTAGHTAGSHAASPGRSWGPRPGHGWHGSIGQGSGAASGWRGHGWRWGGGVVVGAYVPWWWDSAVLFYPGDPGYDAQGTPVEMAPADIAPPVSDRFFCPSSSSYYPEVPTCAVPWLRVQTAP